MDISARDFQERSDLENFVRTNVGLTPDLKTGYQILGTEEELANLQLSESSLFWGIKCVKVNNKGIAIPRPLSVAVEKPNRGEKVPFGINKNEQTDQGIVG